MTTRERAVRAFIRGVRDKNDSGPDVEAICNGLLTALRQCERQRVAHAPLTYQRQVAETIRDNIISAIERSTL